jgi:hypothetical protein
LLCKAGSLIDCKNIGVVRSSSDRMACCIFDKKSEYDIYWLLCISYREMSMPHFIKL